MSKGKGKAKAKAKPPLLQVRELARLQGLPDNFVLPEGRVVATRLIGNAVPPALIRALLL